MTFYIGVDYYPEYWPVERWETYAQQMQEAGFNIVRLAEFSWVLLEPEEGRFDFTWLDDAIAVLERHGLAVMLCTPTATMPAWVKDKYPETLASDNGVTRGPWGVRKNNCFSSGAYRLLSERITQAMAVHYADHSAVIGWQTDNEFEGPVCRCDTCRREFHVFLRQKYGSLDALNTAWGTRFWGHCFAAWEEIPLSTNQHHDNPSLCLDWNRFQTWLQVRFQQDQIDILRRICPKHIITHNFMGASNSVNCFDLAANLDFASFDSYPTFTQGAPQDAPYETALACDITRGLTGKNFWIMETTSGPCGWGEFGRTPRPGEMRKIFYQHVAHGADGQLFFRWRTAISGREQYWHGLLGHDGELSRRYTEASDIAHEAAKLASYLEGTTLQPEVALIYDYDSRWATGIQPGFQGNAYLTTLRRFSYALTRAGVNVDIIASTADFSRYRVVVASQLHVLPDSVAAKLNQFVQDGGVLVTDTRTGVKTETNLCHERRLPGLLSESLGIVIDEYESIEGTYPLRCETRLNGDFTAHRYADWIRPTGADPLAKYQPWFLTDYSAVTRYQYGLGFGYYVGVIVEEDAFYDQLLADVLETAQVSRTLTPPPGVEVSIRSGNGRSLLFLINHTEEPKTLTLPHKMRDVISGLNSSGEITMERFGVHLFDLSEPDS